MGGWFKHESPNGTFYSPFSKSRSKYTYAGSGDRLPTPKEMVDFLSEHSGDDNDVFTDNLGYITVFGGQEAKGNPIDLPGGAYIFKPAGPNNPERLMPIEIRKEGYVEVVNLTENIKEDIDNFLANENLYREDNLMYKLGVLLYGPPGSGKTSILRQLLNHTFPADTITIYLYNMPSTDFLQKITETLPERLKIFVLEELLTVIEHMPLHIVLNFLDGEHSIDRSITFATTNYPEKLPGNLVDRPSRFDKRYKLGNPKKADRKKILEFYLKREVSEEELALSTNLSAASLKEISMLIRVKKLSFAEAVETLKSFSEMVRKDFSTVRSVGFATSAGEDD